MTLPPSLVMNRDHCGKPLRVGGTKRVINDGEPPLPVLVNDESLREPRNDSTLLLRSFAGRSERDWPSVDLPALNREIFPEQHYQREQSGTGFYVDKRISTWSTVQGQEDCIDWVQVWKSTGDDLPNPCGPDHLLPKSYEGSMSHSPSRPQH